MLNFEMESINIEGIPATKDIGVILGFFHNRISQQEKDIGLINRRVSELYQTAQFTDHEKLQLFIDESNQKFENFASSIKTLKSQVLILTNSSPLISPNFPISDNLQIERRQEIRDEINKINSEIESLKGHMIRISQNQVNETNAKDSNGKTKQLKKQKLNKPNIISMISIVDITPQTAQTPKISQLLNEQQQFKRQLKDQQNNIEFIKKEINEIKNEMNHQENKINNNFSITMKQIDEIKQMIIQFNSENPTNSEIVILNHPPHISSSNSELPKFPFTSIPIISNQNDDYYSQYEMINSKKVQVENKKTDINNENSNRLLSNSPSKKCVSPSIYHNSSPRKTSTHYTIISGESLKRPGTQIGVRKAPKPPLQKYPL